MPTVASESAHFRYMVSCATGNCSNLFCFDSNTKPLTFFRCQHSSSPPARSSLSVADLSGHSTMDSIASLRPVCETIFYFLLLGYMTGIRAQYQRPCSWEEENDRGRENKDAWQTENRLAEQALQQAIATTAQAASGDYIQAEEVAKDASERLEARPVLTFAELEGLCANYGLTEIALQQHGPFTNGKSVTLCRNEIQTESMPREFGFQTTPCNVFLPSVCCFMSFFDFSCYPSLHAQKSSLHAFSRLNTSILLDD